MVARPAAAIGSQSSVPVTAGGRAGGPQRAGSIFESRHMGAKRTKISVKQITCEVGLCRVITAAAARCGLDTLNGAAMSDLVTIVALVLGVVSFILYIVEAVFALRNKPVEPAKDVMQRAAQAAVQKTPTIDEFNRMIEAL